MTAKELKNLKPLNKVQNTGSGRVYMVAEIEPDILLVRAVIGERLAVCRLANLSEWEIAGND